MRLVAATCALLLVTACAGKSPDTSPAAPGPSTAASSMPAEATEDAVGTEDFGPNAVSFISAEHGWALSPGSCKRCGNLATTTDAGAHWTTVAHELRLPGHALELVSGRIGMYFADREHGYLYAEDHCRSCLLTTTDGGQSWQPTSLPAIAQLVGSDDTTLGGSDATIYALALSGGPDQRALFRSAPGSNAWTRLRLPTTSPATFVAAQGGTVAALAKGNVDQHGRLWVSPDRGDTWAARPVPCRAAGSGATILSLTPGNPSAVLIDCFDGEQSQQAQFTQHHVYGSTDSGLHWTRLGDPPQTGDSTLLADNGAGRAFLATEAGGGDLLATTLDGGLHWRRSINTHTAGFYGWAGLRFVSPTTGFIFGPTHYAPEQLYRTLDGGLTWHRLPLPRPH